MSTIKKDARKTTSLRKARTTVAKGTTVAKPAKVAKSFDYTFENGMKVTGTIEQIEKVAATMRLKVNYKSLGHRPTGYYQSTSKGMVKISEMNVYHLRRALLKEAKEYYSGMYNPEDSNKVFMEKFTAMAENPLIIELFTELSKR